MLNSRMTEMQKRADRLKRQQEALQGSGLYLFQNNTGGDLMLPKPAAGGQRMVLKDKQFQGDSYFLSMVRNNQLVLVKEITNQQEKLVTEQKLILDQPERFTAEGKTEQVVETKKKKPVNEASPGPQKLPEVLLTEDPMEGIEILRD